MHGTAHRVIEFVGEHAPQHTAERRVAQAAVGCVFDIGQHAADRPPQPAWPGPRVHATWPERPGPGPAAEQAVGSADPGSGWPSWPDHTP